MEKHLGSSSFQQEGRYKLGGYKLTFLSPTFYITTIKVPSLLEDLRYNICKDVQLNCLESFVLSSQSLSEVFRQLDG